MSGALTGQGLRPWRDGDDLRLLEVWPAPETPQAAA